MPYINVYESFDFFVESILESNALGLIGFTTSEGTAYSYVHSPNITHYHMITNKVNVSGNRDALISSCEEVDDPNKLQWRYNFSNRLVYIWKEHNSKSKEVLEHLMGFLEAKRWQVNGVKYLNNWDNSDEADDLFKVSHFKR